MHRTLLALGAAVILAGCTTTDPAAITKTPLTPEQQQIKEEQERAKKEENCRKALQALGLARNTAVALIVATAKKDKSKEKEIFYATLAYNTALGAATIYGCDITPALMAPLPPRPETPQPPQ